LRLSDLENTHSPAPSRVRLNLNYDALPSNFAFNFNLRPYIKAIKDGIIAKAEGAAKAKKEMEDAAAAEAAVIAAAAAAMAAADEKAKKELALKVLTGMTPPLITEEQLAEAKVALTPEAPPPVEVAEGEVGTDG